MTPKAPRSILTALTVLAALTTGGCGSAYVNANITDPSEAKSRLAQDKALCKQEANDFVPPTYGVERFDSDPTPEAQATRWVANVSEDDANANAFTRCMQMRGWEFKKR